jgi:translation initiation factor IF-1
MANNDIIPMEGVIEEAYRSSTFRVRLENGHEALCQLSGKMRQNRIKVLIGDKVQTELSPYDPKRGRIVYRWK